MKTHELKTWPGPFAALWKGDKRFEIRRNDRMFAVGDILHLREYNSETGEYSGRIVFAKVSYVAHGGEWSVAQDHVVLSLKLSGRTA